MQLPPGQYFGSTSQTRSVAGFTCIEKTYSPGQSLPKHSHESAHICYTLSGEYREHIGRTEYRRQPGVVIYYPPGAAHGEQHDSQGRHFLLDLGKSGYELLAGAGHLPDAPIMLPVSGIAAALVRNLRGAGARSTIESESLAIELVGTAASATTSGRWPYWLGLARDALIEQHVSPPTLVDLARDLGVHPVHLARAFRQRFGCPIGAFIRRVRADHACRLLVEDALPASQIALECGFVDQSHMGRVFRRTLGTTPLKAKLALQRAATGDRP